MKSAELVTEHSTELEASRTDGETLYPALKFDAATPISFVRSSLFGIHDQRKAGNAGKSGKPNAPTYEVNRKIHVANDLLQAKLFYTGPELHQRHMTAWQAVIAAAAARNITCDASSPLDIAAADLLKLMGASTDGKARKDLEQLLRQLTQANITLETRLYSYSGSLLSEYEAIREVAVINGKKVVRASRVRIQLNPRLTRLLQNQVVLDTLPYKATLSRNQLAMRLCDLIASHLRVPPMSVSELKDLCGSKVGELKVFRFNLRKALDKLIEVGLVISWDIDRFDRLTVEKAPTDVNFWSEELAAKKLQKAIASLTAPQALPVAPGPTEAPSPTETSMELPVPEVRRARTYQEHMEDIRKADPTLKGMPKWEQDKHIRARLQRTRGPAL